MSTSIGLRKDAQDAVWLCGLANSGWWMYVQVWGFELGNEEEHHLTPLQAASAYQEVCESSPLHGYACRCRTRVQKVNKVRSYCHKTYLTCKYPSIYLACNHSTIYHACEHSPDHLTKSDLIATKLFHMQPCNQSCYAISCTQLFTSTQRRGGTRGGWSQKAEKQTPKCLQARTCTWLTLYVQVRALINKFWPDSTTRPKLVGPAMNPRYDIMCAERMDASGRSQAGVQNCGVRIQNDSQCALHRLLHLFA